jgi:hypothetical protein
MSVSISGDGSLSGIDQGLNIIGNINASSATITGNVSVAGTVTYEDTTNVDSIGVITARSGIVIQSGGDSQISLKNTSGVTKAYVGTSGAFGSASTDDLRIRSDSSNIIFGFNGFESARITSGNFVGIGITNPSAVLHAREQSTKAPSLTWGASCGQIFRNEDSELAFGLSNESPYPLWIQGRTNTNGYRDIVVNSLGGNFGVGVVPWNGTTNGLNFKTLVANYQANGSMTTSSWADTSITLNSASSFVFAKIIAVGHENGRNNGFREYFVSWNPYAGWSTNLLVTSNQGNDYGLVDVRMNGSTVQVKAVNNASNGQYRLYVTHYLT